MGISEMIVAVDDEIARLQLVKKLLTGDKSGIASATVVKGARARSSSGRGRHVLSAEARERIASAQRKRWAAVKRTKKMAKQ